MGCGRPAGHFECRSQPKRDCPVTPCLLFPLLTLFWMMNPTKGTSRIMRSTKQVCPLCSLFPFLWRQHSYAVKTNRRKAPTEKESVMRDAGKDSLMPNRPPPKNGAKSMQNECKAGGAHTEKGAKRNKKGVTPDFQERGVQTYPMEIDTLQ